MGEVRLPSSGGRVEREKQKGKDVYMALGQTDAGRYLTILFIDKGT